MAEELDLLDITWIRPEPLPYTDLEGKTRLYYSDFYLPDFDLYLDPKCYWVVNLQVHKLKEISSRVTLWYGDIDPLIMKVRELVSFGGNV